MAAGRTLAEVEEDVSLRELLALNQIRPPLAGLTGIELAPIGEW
ncbi:MAG TPA: hypothetical protein VGW38_08935 [Chloroflexota bacterium]|nr:hypothetical protein [Chloroflexota bacterium]